MLPPPWSRTDVATRAADWMGSMDPPFTCALRAGPAIAPAHGSGRRWTRPDRCVLAGHTRAAHGAYASAMPHPPAARLDFEQLIAAVEYAPPVAAADVLGERVRTALGASRVSFLLADFSGQALIRLGHAGG